MTYKVINPFVDLQDNSTLYKEGDSYPREGLSPSKTRVRELSSTKNKIGKVLIEEIKTPEDEQTISTPEESKEISTPEKKRKPRTTRAKK